MFKSRFAYSCCIVGAAVCWGLTGIFTRTLTGYGFDAEQIQFVRVASTLVFMTIACFVVSVRSFRIKLKDLWVFLGSGLLSVTMFGMAYMNAQQQMSLSLAVVLLYTSPIWVVLLSAVLFKERITGGKIAALVLVAGGAVFTVGLIGGEISATPFGLLLGLISGFGYALYSIFTRFAYNKGYAALTVTFYTFLFSTIATSFFCDVPGLIEKTLHPTAEMLAAGGSTLTIFAWQMGMGALTCFLPYVLYSQGLKDVENGKASILASMEMVVATLISVAIYAEPFTWMNGIGIVLVFAGIVAMNSPSFRRRPKRARTPRVHTDGEQSGGEPVSRAQEQPLQADGEQSGGEHTGGEPVTRAQEALQEQPQLQQEQPQASQSDSQQPGESED